MLKYFLNQDPWHYLFIFPSPKFLLVHFNRSLFTPRFVWELCLHNLGVSLAQVFLLLVRPSWKMHPYAASVSLPGSLSCITFLCPEPVDSHTGGFSWPLPKHLHSPRRSPWHTGYHWIGITQSLRSALFEVLTFSIFLHELKFIQVGATTKMEPSFHSIQTT